MRCITVWISFSAISYSELLHLSCLALACFEYNIFERFVLSLWMKRVRSWDCDIFILQKVTKMGYLSYLSQNRLQWEKPHPHFFRGMGFFPLRRITLVMIVLSLHCFIGYCCCSHDITAAMLVPLNKITVSFWCPKLLLRELNCYKTWLSSTCVKTWLKNKVENRG